MLYINLQTPNLNTKKRIITTSIISHIPVSHDNNSRWIWLLETYPHLTPIPKYMWHKWTYPQFHWKMKMGDERVILTEKLGSLDHQPSAEAARTYAQELWQLRNSLSTWPSRILRKRNQVLFKAKFLCDVAVHSRIYINACLNHSTTCSTWWNSCWHIKNLTKNSLYKVFMPWIY